MSNTYFYADCFAVAKSMLNALTGLLPIMLLATAGSGLLPIMLSATPGPGLLPMMLPATPGPGLLPTIAASAPEKNCGKDDEVYAVYSRGGGMDIYANGDRYGHKLEIFMDGRFCLYRRIYQKDEKDSNHGSIQDQTAGDGELDPARMDSLRSLIDKSDFFSLPSRLPDVSPHEVEHRTPAETVIITIRKEDGTLHRVQAGMGVDSQHYPEDFLEIHRFLRNWQRELILKISGQR